MYITMSIIALSYLISQANHPTCKSEEYKAFNAHFAVISDAIQDPVNLARLLLQVHLINESLYRDVSGRELVHSDKVSKLMQCVLSQIKFSADSFYVFIEVLEKDCTLSRLSSQLLMKCSKGKSKILRSARNIYIIL